MDKYILFVFKLVSISICEYMKVIFEAILNAIDIYSDWLVFFVF